MKYLLRYFVLLLSLLGCTHAAIIEAEYFLNSDPGQGNGVAIPVSGNGASLDVTVDPALIAALSYGYHHLAMRVKNDSGQWSNAEFRTFAKLNPSLAESPLPTSSTIVAAEYYIDSDPGQGQGEAISLTGNGTSLDVSVDPSIISALSDGNHILAVRFKNVEGNWSNAEFRQFVKAPDEVPAPVIDPMIASLEYQWFQSNVAVSAPMTITASPVAKSYSFSELASLAGLIEGGVYQILFTPIDTEGRRGLWETRTVTIETTDSDGDGVPDQWELQYGFDPNDSADLLASGDLDMDGVTDKDEFLNGSKPNMGDSDGDGIEDRIEINLASLGLDPAVSNAELADLVNNSLTDGLKFEDMRLLKPGAPILVRDPTSGKFTMTMAWAKSTDLSSGFTPMPLAPGEVFINAEGEVEAEFDPAPGASKAFYRIEVEE
ncbi:MAG: thrombospondin type 3 repeat-containing protein [Opitutaceae bacterium]